MGQQVPGALASEGGVLMRSGMGSRDDAAARGAQDMIAVDFISF